MDGVGRMTDWEGKYRDGGELPWDRGGAAPPLLKWMRAGNPAMLGQVVVPGCGLGHDAAAIAREHPDSRVTGIDISPAAVVRAEKLHRKIPNLKFLCADFFEWSPPGGGGFDWLFEHTCFCAIDLDRRVDYVDAAARLLRPGGRLLAVFYLNPYDEEHEPGEGPPHGVGPEQLEEFFAGRFRLEESLTPDVAYPGREGRELLRRLVRMTDDGVAG